MEDRQRIEGVLYREVPLSREAIVDEEERTVRISFSSELPVLRASWFEDPWLETLGHKDGEMNLSRLENGATVHYNHSRKREDRIGVVESASVRKGRGEALVRLSRNARVDDVWDDIKDGLLRNVSVGYSIDERKLVRDGSSGEPDEYRVTRWTPMEISFVDIPADHTVGVGRDAPDSLAFRAPGVPAAGECYRVVNLEPSKEETTVDNTRDVTPADDGKKVDEGTRTAEQVVDLDKVRKDAAADGRRMEAERRTEIRSLFEDFKVQLGEEFEAERDACIDDAECNVEDARKRLLKALGKGSGPIGSDARVEAGEAEEDKFSRGAGLAIAVRAGISLSDKERQEAMTAGLRGFTLLEFARKYLEFNGENTARLGKLDLVGRAFTTSDFPLLLQDASNKMMLKGYDEAPETWRVWAQTGSLSDFKVGNRLNLSSFDDLELVNEAGEFKYGTFTEEGETIQLATYGKLFSISRQAIINDDLSAFTRIPQRMGRSASRVVGDLAYGAITSNPTMGDGVALFNAAHNNLNESGAGGTPLTADAAGVAALAAMDVAMGLQTDISGNATALNIRPAYLLVPRVLERIATQLMSDTTAPGQANPGVTNTVRGLAEVVSDPRLDADSATRYYLAAGQSYDTVEVAFLDGVEAPMLEQQQGWTVDGTEFKVRIDVGVAPTAWRTWQRDDGT